MIENITLSNGVRMPLEGFGVFQIPDPEVCRQTVYDAISAGYRLIDTAALYYNEKAVGEGVRQAIADGLVKREDLFIVTKLWCQDFSYEGAKKGIETSLSELQMDYVDGYLLHQPYGDVYGAWKAVEEAYEAGKFRAIGVANFSMCKMAEFCTLVNVKPMIDQIELNPFFTQTGPVEYMRQFGCVPMAWAPLAEGKNGIFTHPVLSKIGEKYGKSAAQTALRWNTQRGVIIIPKSVHKERMEQNIDIWDFTLTDEEMRQVESLDLGVSQCADHTDPNVVGFLTGLTIKDWAAINEQMARAAGTD